ncbi:hypothetical protein KKB71_01190 [Patescibacteria group bacterium]|nr:hypothetical protein [Patescibacteria group bacterium]
MHMELNLNNKIDNQNQRHLSIKTDFKRKIIIAIIIFINFFILNAIFSKFSGLLNKFGFTPDSLNGFLLLTIFPSLFLSHYILKYREKKFLISVNFFTSLLLYLALLAFLSLLFPLGIFIYLYSAFLVFLASIFVFILVFCVLFVIKKTNNSIVKISISPVVLLCIYLFVVIIPLPGVPPLGICSSYNDLDCVTNLIQKKKDAGLCDHLEDPNTCYYWVYNFGHFDESICDTIKNSEEHEYCYCRFTGICKDNSNILNPIMYLLGDWMREKGVPAGFMESNENQMKINNIRKRIKDETGNNVEYIIYTHERNLVVKARINNSDYFYCTDNGGYSNKQISIEGNNFFDKTYCSGDKCLKNMTNEPILCWPE